MTAAADSWRKAYPFTSHRLDLDGPRLHYLDEGADREGPPLLAVHGNPTWSFYYRRLVRRFQDRHRVVAVDHVGCGLSDKPQHYRYTLAQHRDNLLRLIEHLDLREITLVVHDWGGAIGLSAAVEQPERFARLVLLNTAAFPPPYLPRRIAVCRWPVLGPLAVRGGNAFARAAVTMAMADQTLDPLAKAGLLAPYGNWHDRVAIQRFVEDIPMTPRHPTYAVLEDLERRLPTLADRPIQLIWGMQDWCFRPECLRRLQAIWPQAATLELAQAGHYVLEDAPDAVLDGIERGILAAPPADASRGGVTAATNGQDRPAE